MEKIYLHFQPYADAPDPRRVDVLDGVRALCVFLVGWYHIWQQGWLSPLFIVGGRIISLDFLLRSGYLWVDGLMLLSAVCLYLPYASCGKNTAVWPFYKRRLIRIVPSYLLCILPLFILAMIKGQYPSVQAALFDLFTHLTFTHTFFPATYQQTLLNGALWTLAVEMQFYLIFPFLARAFRKFPILTWCLMTGSAFLYRFFVSSLPDTSMYINQLPAFLDVYANGFLTACILVALQKKLGKSDRKIKLFFTVGFIICVCQLLLIARGQAAENGYDFIRLGQLTRRFPLSATLCCAILCAAFGLPALRYLLGNPVMRVLSAVSFQFYIYHQLLAVRLKEWHFPPSLSDTPWMSGDYGWQMRYTLLCFILALAVAALVTYLFERPIARRLRQ